jgi:uncharacterized protein with GYD domain
MALYMLMGRYSTEAIRDIVASGSNREAAAAAAIEAAGGKLVGFYGMFGQEYNVAIIADMPGHAEYIGAVAPAIGSGVLESYKTIPLYTAADVVKGSKIAKRVAKKYKPPKG